RPRPGWRNFTRERNVLSFHTVVSRTLFWSQSVQNSSSSRCEPRALLPPDARAYGLIVSLLEARIREQVFRARDRSSQSSVPRMPPSLESTFGGRGTESLLSSIEAPRVRNHLIKFSFTASC